MGRQERPLDPTAGPVAAFAYELRQLRHAAGSPTYRALARRAGYAPSVLSTAANGAALPPLPVLLAYIGACGGDRADWEQRWQELAAKLAAGAGDSARPAPEPRQLPAAERRFAGRTAQLAALARLLDDAPDALAVIHGSAGVGKTAVAVHWAHRVADRFPDGQLYVSLRGFDPGGTPMPPEAAVRGFLDALHVPADRVPATLDAQAALYRSLLTGRRMLILLDNAADVTQVRPLLPGTAGCLVLVTSRNQLTGLVAKEGASPLTLDVLPPAEARDLLVAHLGADRVAAEPDAVADIVERCGRLPLALAVVAARAATHPGFPLAALAGELHDLAADVRAAFSWSYRRLAEPAARLFRLLAFHPGPDLAAAAAASLAGLPPEEATPLLAGLAEAHLVAEPTPGRYAVHDLLRAYAAEQADRDETADGRRAATGRLLDHYTHTARTASFLISPLQDPIDLAPARAGAAPVVLADDRGALRWLDTERPALVALAVAHPEHAGQLGQCLRYFFQRQGRWHDLLAVQAAALAAADAAADLPGYAGACRQLALAYGRLGRYDEAHDRLRDALRTYAELGDRPQEEARTHLVLAGMLEWQDRRDEALTHAERALALHETARYPLGQANALNAIGWIHARRGDHRHALDHCGRALDLFTAHADAEGQAAAWDSLGYAHHHLGHHDEAVRCYLGALDVYRGLGDRFYEADTLTHLGDTHHAVGEPDAARAAWEEALGILVALDRGDAAAVRAKLDGLPAAAT